MVLKPNLSHNSTPVKLLHRSHVIILQTAEASFLGRRIPSNSCVIPHLLYVKSEGVQTFYFLLRHILLNEGYNTIHILGHTQWHSLCVLQGADSTHESTDAIEAAKSLAQINDTIVAVSGAVDIVTDGQRVVGVRNGVPMLQKVTATGCSVTAVIAALVAMDPSKPFEATATALSVFGLAGEVAMAVAKGPGSLRMHLIDALHNLDQATVLQGVRISNMS